MEGGQESRIASLEELIGRDVGRNIGALVAAARGGLLGAARSLALHPAPVTAILTGAFMPSADPPAPETDGVVGSAELAAGLAASGCTVSVVTDDRCRDAVVAALTAARADAGIALDVLTTGAGGEAEVSALIERYRDELGVTHTIAVERLGPAADGKVRDMSGRDLSDSTAPLHRFFEEEPWNRIGIGDGGNEIGMGVLSSDLVSTHVSLGSLIHCTVPCDHLVVSGTSNWGAQALLAAVAILDGEHRDELLSMLSPERHRSTLIDTVRNGPAVDGVTQTMEPSVDGLSIEEHCAMVREILTLARADD